MNSVKKTVKWSQIVLIVIVFLFLIVTMFPIYIMLVKSVQSPIQELKKPYWISFPLRFANYSEAWKHISISLPNTFIISFAITFLNLVFSSTASYGFTRFDFPGKTILFYLILALLMVPGVLTLVPQYQLIAIKYKLINTRIGVILPTVAGGIPMGMFLIKTFFDAQPKDLFEAATLDGANDIVMYFYLAIPLSIPILLTQGITTFLGAYNDYLWPLLILRVEEKKTTAIILKTVTNTLYAETGSMCVAIAGYVISSLPMLIVFLICSKQFIAGLTSGAIKM